MARSSQQAIVPVAQLTEAYPAPTRGVVPEPALRPREVLVVAPRRSFGERFGALLGRLLICHIFLLSGVHKLSDWNATQTLLEKESQGFFDWLSADAGIASSWMSAIPVLLTTATVFELAGGLSLLLGYKARFGAFLLFLFLIPTTLIFHSFWRFPQAEQQLQMIMFMKNLAIMGGVLMVMSFGPGMLSVDARARRIPVS